MTPGASAPAPHSHDGFDETVYGLRGVVNYVVEGRPTKLLPGEVIHVPRGVVHGFGIFNADYFRESALPPPRLQLRPGPPDQRGAGAPQHAARRVSRSLARVCSPIRSPLLLNRSIG
jgi:hypothetical protein